MNLILLDQLDFTSPTTVILRDRRLTHLREVHRAGVGAKLRVGLIGGRMGHGHLTSLSENEAHLSLELGEDPPTPLPLTLFLALPRPKFLARIVQAATSLGIKRVFLFNSYRVDKVYWSCAQLEPAELREACLLGLEQARDTILPVIHQRRLFKPFVEDELPALIRGTRAFVAHPGASESCPYGLREPVSLAIGPEGGFIEYELEKFEEAGLTPVRTLERILKVETALTSIVGRLM